MIVETWEALADALLRGAAARRAPLVGPVELASLVAALPSFVADGGVPADDTVGVARRAVEQDRSSAFAGICANAGLDAQQAEMLALLVAVDGDADRSRVVAALHGDNTHRPTLGLLAASFGADSSALAAVSGEGALARCGFTTLSSGRPWARTEVVLDPSVTWAVTAGALADDGLPAGLRAIDGDPADADGDAFVLVVGTDPARRRQCAVANARGSRFLVSTAPADDTGWAALVRRATLTGRSIVVELDDELPADGRRWIERATHLGWAITSRVQLPVETLPERRWREVRAADPIATDAELQAAFGAQQVEHRLTARQLELARRVWTGDEPVSNAVKRLASGDLDRLAVRIEPSRGWADLILPDEQSALVHEVVDRYRHRHEVYGHWGFRPLPSAGVVALFAGPPGTGKTLSAEVVAGELGLDLFRVDLASIVSKYIGETEKNLDRIFRAAEGGTMVLLFDEADAVFAKRSEVADSHDRYANLETSYLLQELERFDGLTILTSNYASNIDDGFIRRIHVSVAFPSPDEAERLRLWQLSFPPAAPIVDLDLAFLAHRFKLTGASIRSIALGAAFRAAAGGGPITMTTVVAALQADLRKQGRLATAHDFGPYAP